MHYGNTVAGPAANAASPEQAIALLRRGLGNLTPAMRQQIESARAQMTSPAAQNALAAALLPRTPRRAELVSVIVGLGLPLTNPQLRAAYSDLLAATTGHHLSFSGQNNMVGMATVGTPNHLAYDGQGISGFTTSGPNHLAFDGQGINGVQTTGRRQVGAPHHLSFDGNTINGQQQSVGGRLMYGNQTMNAARSW